MASSLYYIPQSSSECELEIKRSRFLATLDPVTSRQEALRVIARQKANYPDARHHCWAYVIGSPATCSAAACSDDGEPQGTAGKPMLNVLQQQAIGDCVAVVVRYFGGIKLGAGGLVRAYGGAVQAVLDVSSLKPFERRVRLGIRSVYEYESGIRLMIERLRGSVEDVAYSDRVYLVAEVLEADLAELQLRVRDLCRGQVELTIWCEAAGKSNC